MEDDPHNTNILVEMIFVGGGGGYKKNQQSPHTHQTVWNDKILKSEIYQVVTIMYIWIVSMSEND